MQYNDDITRRHKIISIKNLQYSTIAFKSLKIGTGTSMKPVPVHRYRAFAIPYGTYRSSQYNTGTSTGRFTEPYRIILLLCYNVNVV
jgi:hypothetical protein